MLAIRVKKKRIKRASTAFFLYMYGTDKMEFSFQRMSFVMCKSYASFGKIIQV